MSIFTPTVKKRVGAVTGASVFAALTCPLMSEKAEAFDIDKAPTPAVIAAVATSVSGIGQGYTMVYSVLEGEVSGTHGDPAPFAVMCLPRMGSGE